MEKHCNIECAFYSLIGGEIKLHTSMTCLSLIVRMNLINKLVLLTKKI